MPKARARPRLLALLAVGIYLLAGFTTPGIRGGRVVAQTIERCPAPTLAAGGGADGITVLQGNAWMLPTRPLLLPYQFSIDGRARIETLIRVVRSCRPGLVLLEEVFEKSMVEVLEQSLPEYRVFTSGETDFTGTVNASGLVTLSRLPAGGAIFHPFAALPAGAQTIEKLGRKGFLALAVDAPGFRGTVVNLHLYAFREPAEADITRGQLGEVVDYAREEEAHGRRVLLAGDFNLDRGDMEALLPTAWAISSHGPTYDPTGNRYAVTGGVRTIDFLVNAAPGVVVVRSHLLKDPHLSDHWFLEHRITLGGE